MGINIGNNDILSDKEFSGNLSETSQFTRAQYLELIQTIYETEAESVNIQKIKHYQHSDGTNIIQTDNIENKHTIGNYSFRTQYCGIDKNPTEATTISLSPYLEISNILDVLSALDTEGKASILTGKNDITTFIELRMIYTGKIDYILKKRDGISDQNNDFLGSSFQNMFFSAAYLDYREESAFAFYYTPYKLIEPQYLDWYSEPDFYMNGIGLRKLFSTVLQLSQGDLETAIQKDREYCLRNGEEKNVCLQNNRDWDIFEEAFYRILSKIGYIFPESSSIEYNNESLRTLSVGEYFSTSH